MIIAGASGTAVAEFDVTGKIHLAGYACPADTAGDEQQGAIDDGDRDPRGETIDDARLAPTAAALTRAHELARGVGFGPSPTAPSPPTRRCRGAAGPVRRCRCRRPARTRSRWSRHWRPNAEGGLIARAGPRFFGFVIGGSLPAALAADWLTSAWDQNAGLYVIGPAAAVAEEVAGGWLVDLFGLPAGVSVGLHDRARRWRRSPGSPPGATRCCERAGWDVERDRACSARRSSRSS